MTYPSKALSIILGAKGLLGSELYTQIKKRGDIVVALDKGSDSERIDKSEYVDINDLKSNQIHDQISKNNYNAINIFFAQMYTEKANASLKKIKNTDLTEMEYRNEIISSWINSDSDEFLEAMKNQICFADDFLKKLNECLGNDCYRKNIIFFGSVFEKNSFLLSGFFKNENFFFKHPAYFTAKKSLVAYQSFLADIFLNKNIYINTISPGVLERSQENNFANWIRQKTPISKSLVTVSEVVNIALFLSDLNGRASAIHNQIIYADRGWSSNV
ncbi:SDR family oxidoreductase [Candidatus Methylopumilus planktonicus]|uniref:SDR family oxidoreductase n=1 Tax=Candidatus Methylopumilus planktonicus TaxID=1581557 RepID=UPI001121970D|nr:SDR family oxidoreductase [Candidatus Methylopumilus planktonicus]QDD01769.1 SDR family oxidoreductase [Candidatus Methylopumilus planktonicus]